MTRETRHSPPVADLWLVLEQTGGKLDVSGFTLPGLPAVVVGSNGHVAWGFTNSYIDSADWERLQPCGQPIDAWYTPERCPRIVGCR